jgi:hypothetical protein
MKYSYCVSSNELYLDVECYVSIGERCWKKTVWLDKESRSIVRNGPILFSPDGASGFEEIREPVDLDVQKKIDSVVEKVVKTIIIPEKKGLRKKPKYNHMFDVGFTVDSNQKDWEKVSVEELLLALEQRLIYLRQHPTEAAEAFGFSDTIKLN